MDQQLQWTRQEQDLFLPTSETTRIEREDEDFSIKKRRNEEDKQRIKQRKCIMKKRALIREKIEEEVYDSE